MIRWLCYRLAFEVFLLFSEFFCAFFEYSLKTLRIKLFKVYLYVDTTKQRGGLKLLVGQRLTYVVMVAMRAAFINFKQLIYLSVIRGQLLCL